MTKSELKRKAHSLKPIILIGDKGLTENVHAEIDRGLKDHELIKIKMHVKERDEKKTMRDEIIATHSAQLIQQIGHVIVIYRKNDDH